MLLPMVAAKVFAVEVEIDGLWYDLVSKTKEAKVTHYKNYIPYKGEIVIPETIENEGFIYNVTSIGNAAFSNCDKLTSVTIPNSVKSIEKEAFYACSILPSITIPSSVNYIEESTFAYCMKLCSVTLPNSVTGIGKYAFQKCSSLTTITIPNSVTRIEKEAFQNCSRLSSITIPPSLMSIEDDAFQSCSSLISVHITDIAAWCKIDFSTISSNPLCYAHHLFLNGEEFTNLVVPNDVTRIEKYAFYNCNSLTSITIPGNVTNIGQEVFLGCKGLTALTIQNGVTNIGSSAFKDCSSLTSITIPNSVISLDFVFSGCSSLTSVTIGNGITNLRGSFYGCSSLTSITIPNSVTSIDFAFYGCTGLTSIAIPNCVTSIENRAFYGCIGLTSIVIPNSVKKIGERVFEGCNGLNTISIGNGVETIYSYAFANCPELTDVYCYTENVPSTNSDTFVGSYIEYTTLHVPDVSVNAYKQVEPWKNFKEVVGLNGTKPDNPETPKCEKPNISYQSGELTFNSSTDDADFVYEITDTDIKKGYTNKVQLMATYNISVYATKAGYDNSDVATATLCWIDSEPKTEGITDGIAQIFSKAVLVQSEGGILKVEGIDEGTSVSVFTPDGKQVGFTVCRNGAALISTNIQLGNTAIVKIGDKSVKVVVK